MQVKVTLSFPELSDVFDTVVGEIEQRDWTDVCFDELLLEKVTARAEAELNEFIEIVIKNQGDWEFDASDIVSQFVNNLLNTLDLIRISQEAIVGASIDILNLKLNLLLETELWR